MAPSSSKVASRKFWDRKIWRSIGATQRFDRNEGRPKLWQVGWIRGFSLELAFANLGREILRPEFLAGYRRNAAFRLRRGVARAKSSRYSALDSCVRGAAGANALSTEKKGQKKKIARVSPCFYEQKSPRRVV